VASSWFFILNSLQFGSVASLFRSLRINLYITALLVIVTRPQAGKSEVMFAVGEEFFLVAGFSRASYPVSTGSKASEV